MCGIVGILALSEKGKSYLSKIHDATESLAHSGPEFRRVTFSDESIAMEHGGLSIIEVSEQRNLPFNFSAANNWAILFLITGGIKTTKINYA